MAIVEKRRFTRHPFVAEIRYSSDSPPVIARITDLSVGGMFVDTVNPLEIDTPVTLSFYIPDDLPDKAVTGGGRVAWRQATVGMGIEFKQLNEDGLERLKKFLESI